MKPYLVGIDMGGTFIKTAILNREGEIIAKVEIPSEKEKGHHSNEKYVQWVHGVYSCLSVGGA